MADYDELMRKSWSMRVHYGETGLCIEYENQKIDTGICARPEPNMVPFVLLCPKTGGGGSKYTKTGNGGSRFSGYWQRQGEWIAQPAGKKLKSSH